MRPFLFFAAGRGHAGTEKVGSARPFRDLLQVKGDAACQPYKSSAGRTATR